jgi:hypothetical protein
MCITHAYNFFPHGYTHQLGHNIGIVVSVLEKPLTIIEKIHYMYDLKIVLDALLI